MFQMVTLSNKVVSLGAVNADASSLPKSQNVMWLAFYKYIAANLGLLNIY